MFFSEAKLVARLNHNNIIQIHEMGEIDGDYYIAMEYVRGKSLRDIIDELRAEGRKLPLPHVIDLAIEALRRPRLRAQARDIRGQPMNIVHRDINPHNILISYTGRPEAHRLRHRQVEMTGPQTETGTIKGKFVYMSPEQSAADESIAAHRHLQPGHRDLRDVLPREPVRPPERGARRWRRSSGTTSRRPSSKRTDARAARRDPHEGAGQEAGGALPDCHRDARRPRGGPPAARPRRSGSGLISRRSSRRSSPRSPRCCRARAARRPRRSPGRDAAAAQDRQRAEGDRQFPRVEGGRFPRSRPSRSRWRTPGAARFAGRPPTKCPRRFRQGSRPSSGRRFSGPRCRRQSPSRRTTTRHSSRRRRRRR